MKIRNLTSSIGYLLAASCAAGISAVAVFECTQSIILRVLGVMVSMATFRAMLILDAPPTHSRLNLFATAAVGLPICWPVFDLFRYWLGLSAFLGAFQTEDVGRLEDRLGLPGHLVSPYNDRCGCRPVRTRAQGNTAKVAVVFALSSLAKYESL